MIDLIKWDEYWEINLLLQNSFSDNSNIHIFCLAWVVLTRRSCLSVQPCLVQDKGNLLKGPSPGREKNNISQILASWTPKPCSKLLVSIISASNQLLKLNSSCYTPPKKRQCFQIVSPKKCQCVQIAGLKKRQCVQIVGFKKHQCSHIMGK